MKNLAGIILAAGKGTRMKSVLPKVLHEVAGRPMLHYPVKVLRKLKARRSVVVVGYEAGLVKSAFSGEGVTFVEQARQLGTGHAVMCAAKVLVGFKGDVLILSGDVPLITPATVKALMRVMGKGRDKAVISFVSAILEDPTGYGRVVRDKNNAVVGVVEHKDCKAGERSIREVNTGLYLMDSSFLLKNLKRLNKANAQGEYYLPDLIHLAVREGRRVSALTHLDPAEVMGVNNRVELARANSLMRRQILTSLMLSGVTVIDPDNTYIDEAVKVGKDSTVYPGVHLEGGTSIGPGCVIEEGVKITGSIIGAGSTVRSHTIIEGSRTGKGVVIGPLARLRPGNRLSDGVRIGDFVEAKNCVIGAGSKANHLAYLGDAVIGKGVNIGAGTITCNYDGIRKHKTLIGDGAFIGSDSQLIAPVRVGKNAYVGSGTTVTKDVPPGALVVTRSEEKLKKGWVERKGLLKKKGTEKKGKN